jgi:hypothetical protein
MPSRPYSSLVHVEPAIPVDDNFVLPCGCTAFYFWAHSGIRDWWLHNQYACGYFCEEHEVTVTWEDYYTPWPTEPSERSQDDRSVLGYS